MHIAISLADLALIFLAILIAGMLGRRFIYGYIAISVTALTILFGLHYAGHYPWSFVREYTVTVAIPLVMAWAGNHLAAKATESPTERALWKTVFVLLTFIALIGSFWVLTEKDAEHRRELEAQKSSTRDAVFNALTDYNSAHPEHPITLQQLKEAVNASVPKQAPVMSRPPVAEVSVAVGNDDSESVMFTFKKGAHLTWFDNERACKPPFKCYPEADLRTGPVELNVGTKNWARMFFSVYNIGGSDMTPPTVTVNLSNGHDVVVTRINQRQPITSTNRVNSWVQFSPPETHELVSYAKAENAYTYAVDVTVDSLVSEFELQFRIFSSNLPLHSIVIPVRVVRS